MVERLGTHTSQLAWGIVSSAIFAWWSMRYQQMLRNQQQHHLQLDKWGAAIASLPTPVVLLISVLIAFGLTWFVLHFRRNSTRQSIAVPATSATASGSSIAGSIIGDQNVVHQVQEVQHHNYISAPIINRHSVEYLRSKYPGRDILEKTVEDVALVYVGRTTHRGDAEFNDLYRNRWLVAKGQFKDEEPNGKVRAYLTTAGGLAVFSYFDISWLARVEHLVIGESIVVLGRLERASQYLVALEECELL